MTVEISCIFIFQSSIMSMKHNEICVCTMKNESEKEDISSDVPIPIQSNMY